jgi:hypothetical protein
MKKLLIIFGIFICLSLAGIDIITKDYVKVNQAIILKGNYLTYATTGDTIATIEAVKILLSQIDVDSVLYANTSDFSNTAKVLYWEYDEGSSYYDYSQFGNIFSERLGCGSFQIRNYGDVQIINSTDRNIGNSSISSKMLYLNFIPTSQGGATNNITDAIIDIADNPTTSGTKNYPSFRHKIGENEKINLNPRVADGASAVAFSLGTETELTTAGAKLLEIKNGNSVKFSIDKDGNIIGGATSNISIVNITADNINNADSVQLLSGQGASAATIIEKIIFKFTAGTAYAGTGTDSTLMYTTFLGVKNKIGYIQDTYFTAAGNKIWIFNPSYGIDANSTVWIKFATQYTTGTGTIKIIVYYKKDEN